MDKYVAIKDIFHMDWHSAHTDTQYIEAQDGV